MDRYCIISVHATPPLDEGAFEDASFNIDMHKIWQVIQPLLLSLNLWLSPFGIVVGPDTIKFIESISRGSCLVCLVRNQFQGALALFIPSGVIRKRYPLGQNSLLARIDDFTSSSMKLDCVPVIECCDVEC